MMADPRLLGPRAEQATAAWLAATGWTVLERNWRCAQGELDLVCRDPGGALVGVEVKCRASRRAGSPLESLDPRRVARLRTALGRYAAASCARPGRGLRIDLVAVTPAGDGRWRLKRLERVDAW